MKRTTVSTSPVFYLTAGIVLLIANSANSDMVQGGNAQALGASSTAIGQTEDASNVYTPTQTFNTAPFSLALGYSDKAEAEGGSAIGFSNRATGMYSTALGAFNLSAAPYSTALGVGTSAKTFGQFVVGTYNLEQQNLNSSNWGALSPYDHLFIVGNGTGPAPTTRRNALVVKRNGDMVVSGSVVANGSTLLSAATASSMYVPINAGAVRIGAGTSVGGGVLAIGSNVAADTSDSIGIGSWLAPGAGSVAVGRSHHDPGTDNLTVGIGIDTYYFSNVVAVGQNIVTGGYYSTALGHGNWVWGFGSTGLGYNSSTGADYSTAVGAMTYAGGTGSVAAGYGAYTGSYGEVALGTYNTAAWGNTGAWSATDRLLIVGNGTPAQRRDALVIWKSGRAQLEGQFTATKGVRTPARGDISMGSFQAGTPVLP